MIYFTQEYIAGLIEPWKQKHGKTDEDLEKFIELYGKDDCCQYRYIMNRIYEIYKNSSSDNRAKILDNMICNFEDFEFLDSFGFEFDSSFHDFLKYSALLPFLEDGYEVISDKELRELDSVYLASSGDYHSGNFVYEDAVWLCNDSEESSLISILDALTYCDSFLLCVDAENIEDFKIYHELAKPVITEVYNTYSELQQKVSGITRYLLDAKRGYDEYFVTNKGQEHMERIITLNLDNPYDLFDELSILDFGISMQGEVCYFENADIYESIWEEIERDTQKIKER